MAAMMTAAGTQQPNYLGQAINQNAYRGPATYYPTATTTGTVTTTYASTSQYGGGGMSGWHQIVDEPAQEKFGEGRTVSEDAAWYEAVTQDFPK